MPTRSGRPRIRDSQLFLRLRCLGVVKDGVPVEDTERVMRFSGGLNSSSDEKRDMDFLKTCSSRSGDQCSATRIWVGSSPVTHKRQLVEGCLAEAADWYQM